MRAFLKHAGIVAAWVIGSMLASSFLITGIDWTFGDAKMSALETAHASQISMILIVSGLITTYARFRIKKILAFIIIAGPSILIVGLRLAAFPFLLGAMTDQSANIISSAIGFLAGINILIPVFISLLLRDYSRK